MNQPLPLRSILEQTLKGLELDGPIKAHSIWKAWSQIVGEPIALQTYPRAIRNRILFVHVSHPIWMQQLQFLKPTLLNKIRIFLKEPLIEDIRFKVGNIPKTKTRPKEHDQNQSTKLDRKTLDRIEQLIKNIIDPDLKEGFREIFMKSARVEQNRKKLKTDR